MNRISVEGEEDPESKQGLSEDAAKRSSSTAGLNRDKHGARPIPGFVWMATFTMLTLPLLGSLILPQLVVPDEKHHADMAMMAREGSWIEDGWPGPGNRRLNPAIMEASPELGPRERASGENRAAQHPPLFYLTAAAMSYAATLTVDNPDLALQLWTFRLASVLASAGLSIAFYLIAVELSPNRWVHLASAVVPLAIPGITLRDGAMINTDALLILLTSLSVLFAIRVGKGDLTSRTAIGLGLATGLAALTKGHALVVIPVIVFAYLLPISRDRRISRQWLRSASLSGGISLVVGGWWWVRNLVLHGAIQPLRHIEPASEPTLDWTGWLVDAVQRIVASFWGGGFALGGVSYLPLFWILTVLFLVGCIVGWVRSKDRAVTLVSGMYALLLLPAVFLTSAIIYAERGAVRGVQGRYFFPGIAGVTPLAILAMAGFARRLSRWLPALFVAGAAAMTLLAVRYMLNRYWSPYGSGWQDRWSGVVVSSPFPEVVSTTIFAITGLAFVSLFVYALVTGIKSDLEAAPIGSRH